MWWYNNTYLKLLLIDGFLRLALEGVGLQTSALPPPRNFSWDPAHLGIDLLEMVNLLLNCTTSDSRWNSLGCINHCAKPFPAYPEEGPFPNRCESYGRVKKGSRGTFSQVGCGLKWCTQDSRNYVWLRAVFFAWMLLLCNIRKIKQVLMSLGFCFFPTHPLFSWQFFIMLLIIFVLELTVVILFFVYTDKVCQRSPPSPSLPFSKLYATSLINKSWSLRLGMQIVFS